MDPAAIDLSFVPSRRAGLSTIETGSEALILEPGADRPHLLSPTATLIWSFMDGVGSLGDFATDLVDALGADPSRVRRDLVELTVDLGRRGLLEGIDPETDPIVDRRTGRLGVDGDLVHLTAPANDGLDARFVGAAARVTTVRADSLELDLRADDPSLMDDLLEGFATAGIDVAVPRPTSDHGPTPLYSALVGRSDGPVIGLGLLYRSGRPLRRQRHRDDLVRIAVADVAAVIAREAQGRPLLDAVGLSRAGRMVAVDPVFSSIIDDLEPRLRRQGVVREDASFVAVAPCDRGLELVGLVLRPRSPRDVPEPGQTPGQIALDAIDLARGIGGRLSAATVARLCEAAASAPVTRVPGRDGLRSTLHDLLG